MMLMLSPQFTESPIHSGFQAVSFKHVQGLQKEAEEYRGLQKKAEEYLVEGNVPPRPIRGLPTHLLFFSIVWSMKDTVFLYLKVKFIEKHGFLPAKAKVGLAIRSLLAISSRLLCIVFGFFGPFLGLFNILAHWTAERKKTQFYDEEPSVLKYQEDFRETDTEKSISFSDIFRGNRYPSIS